MNLRAIRRGRVMTHILFSQKSVKSGKNHEENKQ